MSGNNKISKENTSILSRLVKWHIRRIIELLSKLPMEKFDTELVDDSHPGFLIYPITEAFKLQQVEESAPKSGIYKGFGNQAFLEFVRNKSQMIKDLDTACESIGSDDEDSQLFLLQMLSKAAYAHGQLAMLFKESP